MSSCSLLLACTYKIYNGIMSPEQEAEYLLSCRAFAQQYALFHAHLFLSFPAASAVGIITQQSACLCSVSFYGLLHAAVSVLALLHAALQALLHC